MRPILRLIAILAMSFPAAAEMAPVVDTTVYTTKGEVPLRLELAATPAARELGLMDRDGLAPNDGMLFLFPKPSDHGFWMRNTRIPLDMLFICEQRHIVHIESSAEPYSRANRSAKRDDIIAVIELDGGRASRESIAVGDHVRYDLPTNTKIR